MPRPSAAASAWLPGALFFALLIGLPLLRGSRPASALALFDTFYRAGSLVFGGGHVVLPLLQAEVVPPGWVSERAVPRRLRRGAGGARARSSPSPPTSAPS